MDIIGKMGLGLRHISNNLANMSWGRVAVLWILVMIVAEVLPDWPFISMIKGLLPAFGFFCLILKVESGARTLAEGREKVAKAEVLRAHGVVDAWSSKLDCHFLFNAMATIEHLITRDVNLAIKAQSALSCYLRSGLSDSDKSSITGQVKACESYLCIQKIRLSERLNWDIACQADGAMPGRVAVGLLELAVSDGIEETEVGGSISISCIREGERLTWCMECPQSGVLKVESIWRARWLSEAPNGSWHLSVSEKCAKLELGWVG